MIAKNYNLIGTILYELGSIKEAETFFEKAIELA